MKKSFWGRLGWLAAGGAMGIAATVFAKPLFDRPSKPVSHDRFEYTDSSNRLYGQEVTLADLFPDEGLLAAIRNPDRIELHRIDGDGKLEVDGYKFDSKAVVPDGEHAETLKAALISLNAYTPTGKMCGFHPGILVRLIKDGNVYDLLFCFSCNDIDAEFNMIGMSEEGAQVFLRCFSEVFPDFGELAELRPKYSFSSRGGLPPGENK